MVPKFCFPFDVERYRREQTPRDPGIRDSCAQGLWDPGAQALGDSNNWRPIHPGPQYTLLGNRGAQGPVTPGSLRAFPTSREPPSSAVQHFTFALTDLTGTRRFGFCRLRAGARSCLCILRCGK